MKTAQSTSKSPKISTAVTLALLSLVALPLPDSYGAGDAFQDLLDQFSSYDRNKDGTLEINKLELAAFGKPGQRRPG